MRRVLSILAIFAVVLMLASPAWAETCRMYRDREICILSIKRSAKYYWEYRAEVRVDGEKRPLQKYDCRRHLRILRDGTTVPFEKHGAGEYICKLLN